MINRQNRKRQDLFLSLSLSLSHTIKFNSTLQFYENIGFFEVIGSVNKTKPGMKIIVKLLMGFVQKLNYLFLFYGSQNNQCETQFFNYRKYYSEYFYIYIYICIFKKKNIFLIHFRSLKLCVGYFFLGIYQTGQGVFGQTSWNIFFYPL
jgi:hypothetical protein